jgi:hypothetical protein
LICIGDLAFSATVALLLMRGSHSHSLYFTFALLVYSPKGMPAPISRFASPDRLLYGALFTLSAVSSCTSDPRPTTERSREGLSEGNDALSHRVPRPPLLSIDLRPIDSSAPPSITVSSATYSSPPLRLLCQHLQPIVFT